MFTEPTDDDGKFRVVFERSEYRGSRWSEWKGALVDQKGVPFVHMGIRLTKPNSILCKCTKCCVIRVVGLDHLRQSRTARKR